MTQQQAFDIDAMIHEIDVQNAPEWTGAPLNFTSNYHSPNDLRAAFARWQFVNGSFGSIPRSHMWTAAAWQHTTQPDNHRHTLDLFSADLRCNQEAHRPWGNRGEGCVCTGILVYQAICEHCAWHHIGDENTIIERWHDHAWPGWLNLPVLPLNLSQKPKNYSAWITANIPTHWQTPGAPIRTERSSHATRHVAGRSPWNGYDMGTQFIERSLDIH